MQMLKNMFNSDSKYYLELDETQEKAIDTATPANNTTQAKEKAVAKSKPVQEATKEAPKATNKVEENNTVTAPKVKVQKTEKESNAVKQTSAPETNGKTAPVAKNSVTSSSEPPFWVAAMYSNNSSNSNDSSKDSTGQTFATDNLMPTITKSRRRPGPSLNLFREMAKNTRTRRG